MKVLAIISFVLMSATIALPQTKQPVTNLCSLEGTLAQGGTLSVVVAGVHEGGPGKRGTALGILTDAACPDQTARAEIVLQSPSNRKKSEVCRLTLALDLHFT
jgi:hypothetical protein